ncbi:MAG: hypothetical protein KKE50_06620, partial [Nanoarchaeota archaeon]|nr:hypothetical protein [Nanoarchaeota archaeon]
YIRVEEVNDNSGGVGTRIVIGALIAIYVPYPGKYAEISLTTKDVNEGESVPVTLEVSNLGKEDIFVNPVLEIYNYDNTKIDLMNLGLRSARTQAKEKFETQINTKNYQPGVYTAFASVDYGGSETARANSTFRIGTLSVAVVNWTSMFKKGKISKFDIEIESLWNSKINSVYASVNISRDGNMLDYFKTSPSTLEMWQKSTITGYLNAEGADEGSYDANITLYYEDRTSSRDVEIIVYKESNFTIIIIVSVAIAVAISAGIFFILRWKKKHDKTESKKRKK